MKKETRIVALYERLSHDDANLGKSFSIIDEETFNNVQRIRDNVKRYPDGWGEIQPFTGLVFCSDCGGKLYCYRRMIENEIGSQTNEKKDSRKFLGVLKRYTEFEELTPYMINEFIEKIVVHERDRKGSVDTTQQVDIYFNFIGNIELPKEELSAEEQEELRKKEELKVRLHRNYVRRKESGHQKQWEASYAARRRARLLELKAENPDIYGIPLPEYRKMVRKQKEEERKVLEEALS